MKIVKDLKQVIVKPEGKTITILMDDPRVAAKAEECSKLALLAEMFDEHEKSEKFLMKAQELRKQVSVAGTSKPLGNDEFDPYVGAALALAYAIFGSKNRFHKWVKKNVAIPEQVKPEKPKKAKRVKKVEKEGE